MSRRVLILSASVGTGHLSAAAALERALSQIPGVEAAHLDAMQLSSRIHKISYADLYFRTVRRNPWLIGWSYQRSDAPFAVEPLRQIWDRLNATRLVRFIRAYSPEITVCTHFMPASIVGQLIVSGQIRSSLAIVTTDYDLHGLWLSRTFTRYFVALEQTRAYCRALGLPPERITVCGIPVDPAFATPLDGSRLLEHLGLRAELPIILLSAGAAGQAPAQAIVAQLLQSRQDAQVIVICGRNQALRQTITAQVAPQAWRFRVLGFSEQMPQLMRLAWLFIGKPGGLTAAECMAAGLPMLIVAPIPGQEDRNSDHLLTAGAALRCNDLATLPYQLGQALGQLERLRAGARRLGRPGAAHAIAAALLAEPLEPISLSWAQRRQIAAQVRHVAAQGRR